METKEKIEKIIKQQGGRLDYTEFDGDLQKSFLLIKNRAESFLEGIVKQLKGINSISFDIIDNYSFNAFATGFQHDYFIGINRGTIATLSLVFDRLLADKKIFSFIGDIEKEEDNLPLFDNIFMNFEATVDMLPQFSAPKCPIRNVVSKHMIKLALDFILAHETAHIINGHVSLGNNKYNMMLDELSMIGNNEIEKKMVRKTLEMDADSWATTILLSSEINKALWKLPRPGKEFDWIYNRPGIVLMQFAFVISVVFKIFGDKRLNNFTFEFDSYPKPRLRCVISMLAIKLHPDFLELNKKMKFKLDKNGLPFTIGLGFHVIEDAFKKITGKDSNELSIKDAWGETGLNQINKLIDYWNNNLSSKLEKHSYIKVFSKKKMETLSFPPMNPNQ